jgi:hypothetical protein
MAQTGTGKKKFYNIVSFFSLLFSSSFFDPFSAFLPCISFHLPYNHVAYFVVARTDRATHFLSMSPPASRVQTQKTLMAGITQC